MKRYYRFQYNYGFTMSSNFFKDKRLVIAILLMTKAWYLQNQTNEKYQNNLIEQSIEVKTMINSNFSIRYIKH